MQVRSKCDQKRACLVGRMFRNLMLPILWDALETDLCCDVGLFNVLVHPQSNIITHVRHFTLNKCDDSTQVNDLQRKRLAILFVALPRDQLSVFQTWAGIDSHTFRIVVQSQRKLKAFGGPLSEEWSDAEIWSPYLAALEVIAAHIPQDAEQAATTFKRYHALLQQAPEIDLLSIGSSTPEVADISLIEFPRPTCETGEYGFKYLHLHDLQLGNNHTRITDYINLEKLSQLELAYCLDPQPMLQALAKTYAKGACALEDFNIYLPSHAEERAYGLGICHDIETLLLSCSGLINIFLGTSRFGLVSKDCIIHHSRSLQTFGIGISHAVPVAYKLSDLTDILTHCDKLTQLAIPLGIGTVDWVRLCHDVLNLDGTQPDQHQVNKSQATLVSV